MNVATLLPAFAALHPLPLRSATTLCNPALTRRAPPRSEQARSARRAPHPRMAAPSGDSEGDEPSAPKFTQKFDPESDTNVFGRDPKKETDFWRDAAKSVLASEPVREALEKQKKLDADTLTDEQRAYMDFLAKMDASSAPPSEPDN